MADETVRIDIAGLRDFQRGLKTIDAELPKALRKVLNTVADDVIGLARPHVPRRSGRAAGSLKASSTQTAVRVKGGGSRAPYYPWLEFGGRVGRKNSVKRASVKGGRYLYPALARERPRLQQKLLDALEELAQEAIGGR